MSGSLTISRDETSPKRRLMLEAAEQLFLAHGYGSVSMDAVARTAGVSKATLYAHFASKDRLFATIIADRSCLMPLVDGCFPAEIADLRETLERIARAGLAFLLGERTLAIYRIVVAESARFPELGEAFYLNGPRRMVERFAEWLARLQAAGLVRVADREQAAQQFMALLRSTVFLRASLALPPPPNADEIEATAVAAVDTWIRAYGSRPV